MSSNKKRAEKKEKQDIHNPKGTHRKPPGSGDDCAVIAIALGGIAAAISQVGGWL